MKIEDITTLKDRICEEKIFLEQKLADEVTKNKELKKNVQLVQSDLKAKNEDNK